MGMDDAPNVIRHLTSPDLFRSQSNLARLIGVKPHTICEKQKTNNLTHDQMRKILEVGKLLGIPVTPHDFFPEFKRRGRPRKAAA